MSPPLNASAQSNSNAACVQVVILFHPFYLNSPETCLFAETLEGGVPWLICLWDPTTQPAGVYCPWATLEIELGIFWLQRISQARRLEPPENSLPPTLKAVDQLPPAEQSHCPLTRLGHWDCGITQTRQSPCSHLAPCSAPGTLSDSHPFHTLAIVLLNKLLHNVRRGVLCGSHATELVLSPDVWRHLTGTSPFIWCCRFTYAKVRG